MPAYGTLFLLFFYQIFQTVQRLREKNAYIDERK